MAPSVSYLAFLASTVVLLQMCYPAGAIQLPQPENPRYENQQSRVTLTEDRGYTQLLIAIGEYVPENPTLISAIREVFTDLSAYLYDLTNEDGGGVYFKDIGILIPDTWSDRPEYQRRTLESFSVSDIRVDLPPNTLPNRDQPGTNKPTHCGAPGLYVHITPEYFIDIQAASPYGNRNQTLAHEWAHYRWGVFDEYPTGNYPHFYPGSDGKYEATKCVAAIQGRKKRSSLEDCTYDAFGKPDDNCRFIEDTMQTETYEGSLMYKQFLPHMRSFCDNSSHVDPAIRHNAMATNEQNNLCSSRSIWEVLRDHSDFQTVEPSGQIPDLAPNFRLIKSQASRSPVMLVLDTSGSMSSQRLHILRQASYNLITRVLKNGQMFGAVSFESTAQTIITTQSIGADRRGLANLLPDAADGGTSIGAGIRQGIADLVSSGHQTEGAVMIVLTDGSEGEAPFIKDLTILELNGVTVHTIAIGDDATQSLEKLATITGGRTFEHNDNSAALFNIFTELAVQDDSGTLTIFSEPFNLNNITRTFSVDRFSAGRMTILVGFPAGSIGSFNVSVIKPDMTIIDEDGSLEPSDSFEIVDDFDLIQIDTLSMAGDWLIEVTPLSSATTSFTGTMHVETNRVFVPNTNGQARLPMLPILADVKWAMASMTPSEIQTVTVTVHQGYTPVAGASVTVLVTGGNEGTTTLSAYDDGVGADVRANDGVYSAFFTQFKGEGRYSLQVTVVGRRGTTKLLLGSRVGQSMAASSSTMKLEAMDTGSFERTVEGNSFVCTGESCQGNSDVYTPYRIGDLRATRFANMTAMLTFTATGDDLDHGTALFYEIRMSTDFDALLEMSPDVEVLQYVPEDMRNDTTLTAYVIYGEINSPQKSRSKETFHVALPKEGDFSYIFSVVAIDDEGQRSQQSNLASVTAMPPIESDPLKQDIPTQTTIWPIILGVILGLIILTIIALLLVKRRESKKNAGDEETLHKGGKGGNGGTSNAYQPAMGYRSDGDGIKEAGKVQNTNSRGNKNGAFAYKASHEDTYANQNRGGRTPVPRPRQGHDEPEQPTYDDTAIYPFVSVSTGEVDECHSAYQFTRVAETTPYDSVQEASKVYQANPGPPASQCRIGAVESDDDRIYDDAPAMDSDQEDYEEVCHPSDTMNRRFNRM